MKQGPRSLVWCLVMFVSVLAGCSEDDARDDSPACSACAPGRRTCANPSAPESWSVEVSVQRDNGCDVANISPAHGTWSITCQPLELCTPGGCHMLDDGDTWSLDSGTKCYPPK